MSRKFMEAHASTGYSSKKVESKFGMKILEKMGWKEGNGLGRSQSGMTDIIQMRRRDESLGLGASQTKLSWGNEWWKNSLNSILETVKIDLPGIVQDNSDSESEDEQAKNKKAENKNLNKKSNNSSSDEEKSTSSDDTIKEKKDKKFLKNKKRKLTEDFEREEDDTKLLKKKRKRNFKMIKL